jgi:hypothetical protein
MIWWLMNKEMERKWNGGCNIIWETTLPFIWRNCSKTQKKSITVMLRQDMNERRTSPIWSTRATHLQCMCVQRHSSVMYLQFIIMTYSNCGVHHYLRSQEFMLLQHWQPEVNLQVLYLYRKHVKLGLMDHAHIWSEDCNAQSREVILKQPYPNLN